MIDEKLKREFDMIGRDCRLARESYLLRIMRNRRKPLCERFAAMLHYEDLPWEHWLSLPDDDLDDEKMAAGLAECLHEIDRPAR